MRLDGATLLTNFYERATTRKREITLSFSSARIDGARRFYKRKYIISNYADYRARVHETRTRARHKQIIQLCVYIQN